MKQKRSSNSPKEFDCCSVGKVISLPGTRKDVLVKNPQNVHFAKKIIVGSQFQKLLKALYKNHSNDVQAIKRKITDGQIQLFGSEGEGEDDKVNIYNIEGKSDSSKNKTIIELRAAILKLLDKVAKKAKSAHNTEQRDQKDESLRYSPTRRKFGKTVKTLIQESYGQNRSPPSFNKAEDLSAKRANYLDLLNFISRMKSTDIGKDVDLYNTKKMQSLNGMENDGLTGMFNSRDMMTQSSFRPTSQMPDLRNVQHENGFLPGEGMQMQEMNLAEQRKLLEDQLENRAAQLQLKAQLRGQEVPQMQNLQNDKMTNFMRNLQNVIATPSVGSMPLRLRGPAMFQQPPFLPRINPYLPFARPFPRTRTGLPFFRPMDPRVRYPLDDEEDDDDDDEDDNADDDNDYHRDRDEAPPHHPVREHEESDNDDDDGEQSNFDNDER